MTQAVVNAGHNVVTSVTSGGNPVSFVPQTYTVAGLPAASDQTGAIIYCSNGAAGNPCLAFSNGTNWLRCDTLAAVSAT